jgi:hypothetical protein
VFEPRYRELTDDCLAGDGEFGVVLIARGSEVGGGDERFGVGTVAQIEPAPRASTTAGGPCWPKGRGGSPWTEWLPDAPYPVAEVDRSPRGRRVDRTTRPCSARATAAGAPGPDPDVGAGPPAPVVADLGANPVTGSSGDGGRVWRLCEMAPVTAIDSQKLLEADAAADRLALLSEMCEALAADLFLLLGGGGQGFSG